ncbi:MAG: hypothetical protein ABSD44_16205, partial [Terracidiphilus sp.]
MSEPDSTPPVPAKTTDAAVTEPVTPTETPRPSRLRRVFLRHLPLTLVCAAVLSAITAIGLFFWASSAGFEDLIRKRLVSELETATGGRVEVRSFHWHLLSLEAEAGGLVIHGLEASGETPYAQAQRLRVRLSILGFWSPHILLRDLEISRPQLHLIAYADGTTNQPHPRKQEKPGQPALDRFFDLKAGRVVVEQGDLDYENRAAAFDFQDRHIPLDFAANDVSLLMTYMAGGPSVLGVSGHGSSGGSKSENEESYRIEAAANDLDLTRGASSNRGKAQPQAVEGFFQARVDLTRTAAYLRSLRITARSRGVKDRTLEIAGSLDNFAHPRWQATAVGDLDMRLIDPITGYPFAPEGLAHLDLAGAGEAGTFRADGSLRVEDGSYIGTGVVATHVGLDAHIHADPEQLLMTSVVARLRQGGHIDFDLSLAHWLPPLPGAATLRPAGSLSRNSRRARSQPIRPAKPSLPSSDITLPIDGKVTAHFKDVALDTLLEMVSEPPFQHLGFDTRLNGPA